VSLELQLQRLIETIRAMEQFVMECEQSAVKQETAPTLAVKKETEEEEESASGALRVRNRLKVNRVSIERLQSTRSQQ